MNPFCRSSNFCSAAEDEVDKDKNTAGGGRTYTPWYQLGIGFTGCSAKVNGCESIFAKHGKYLYQLYMLAGLFGWL